MLPLETNADTYKHTKLDYHATVREMPSHERPRERLQHFGPQALSLAELLAIILRTGSRGDNALELASNTTVALRGRKVEGSSSRRSKKDGGYFR